MHWVVKKIFLYNGKKIASNVSLYQSDISSKKIGTITYDGKSNVIQVFLQ